MTNNSCHAELVEASRRCRSSVIPESCSRESHSLSLPLKLFNFSTIQLFNCRSRSSLGRAAFTLVELVITIAIVIILSVISVPIYRGYVDKAKWSEGYALAGLILSAQKAYYSEYGYFLREQESGSRGIWTSFDTVLGVDARGNKYFTCFDAGAPDNEKYYFDADLLMPKFDSNKTRLRIAYNITSGVTYREF